MNKLFQRVLFSGSLLFTACTGVAVAQAPPDGRLPQGRPAEVRANAVQQLGLSREQLAEIKKINQARRPQMESAQERLRAASRALDASIYADNVSEEVFQERLKAFHAAQTEVARIRFVNELAVRRVLNAEQAARFRQIRERFESGRRAAEGRPAPERGRLPARKLKRIPPFPNR